MLRLKDGIDGIYALCSFVDRYIPGYEFFGQGVINGGSGKSSPPWKGNGLRITINKNRDVLNTNEF